MKMKVLIVDNHPEDLAVTNMITWIKTHFPGSDCKPTENVHFEPTEVLSFRPDIVILDVALDETEENYFEKLLTTRAAFDAEKPLSGIEYCRRLKTSFSNVPVILMSQYFDSRILTKAIEAGADGFVYKRQLEEEHFIPALEATFVRYKTDDIAFYASLRALLEDEDRGAWNREQMLRAMDAFFTHGSGTRRLTGLWCILAELVEEIVDGDTVNELLRALMDTEALLLAANPRMRDHVRHAGNVFWLGYYLLNTIKVLREPTSLPDFTQSTFSDSALSPFKQMNLAWLLAALLHDIGYLRERLKKIEERIDRGRSLFMSTSKKKFGGASIPAPAGLELLQPYLKNLGAEGALLYSAIAHTMSLWGKSPSKDDTKIVTDHGIASASALLEHLNKSKKEGESHRPEVLHASAAIALHNLSKWNTEWRDPSGDVELPVNILPVAWLLAYCDELQGWGREPEADPFNVEDAKKVSEARRRYKEGYVKGSRISSFEVKEIDKGLFKSRVEVDIQYMMVHGENPEAAPADVRTGIKRWRRERVKPLRRTLGLDDLLETTITHKIPGPEEKDIDIKLDARMDHCVIPASLQNLKKVCGGVFLGGGGRSDCSADLRGLTLA